MQNLEVISVNIWQILISLANLTILFLLLKKFLYKPVRKVVEERRKAIDGQYAEADAANKAAQADREEWERKRENAKAEADEMLKEATVSADRRSERIVAEARQKADGILRQAETQAELERRKAEDEIKKEIVDVSSCLTEKILGREIKEDDHRELIDSFLREIEDDNDRNE